ncbi:MAG TPA: putative molybdenum carrier protein [Gemmataceae bacterium]|nr:putative molybdenum carrier protein [Gemmataceae bacterium]
MITKIISGGQTGVDRAALDVALELGLPCGGWCPRGRRAEDGPIPQRYPLAETSSRSYAQRTKRNVLDSDGTLVLTRGRPGKGTALTIQIAAENQKPHRILELSQPEDPADVRSWCREHQIHVLNVAGPRESEQTGIYVQAVEFLKALLG